MTLVVGAVHVPVGAEPVIVGGLGPSTKERFSCCGNFEAREALTTHYD